MLTDVDMFTYICIYIFTHTYLYISIHIYLYIHIDWCCFYYFVRNSLVPLLKTLCAWICSLDPRISVFYIYVCMYVFVRTHILVHMCIHNIYIYSTYIYIYIYTHKQDGVKCADTKTDTNVDELVPRQRWCHDFLELDVFGPTEGQISFPFFWVDRRGKILFEGQQKVELLSFHFHFTLLLLQHSNVHVHVSVDWFFLFAQSLFVGKDIARIVCNKEERQQIYKTCMCLGIYPWPMHLWLVTLVPGSIFGPLLQTHFSKRVFMDEISSSALLDIQLILLCVCGVDSFLPD